MAWSVPRCASAMGGGDPYCEDAAAFGSRYQVEAKSAGRDGEDSSEAGAEHPTEHVCGHFKQRGRIGGRRQRAILFMVKAEELDIDAVELLFAPLDQIRQPDRICGGRRSYAAVARPHIAIEKITRFRRFGLIDLAHGVAPPAT